MTEESCAYEMTSSMRMEVEAVTAAFHCFENTQFSQAVYVTNSLSMLQKIETGIRWNGWNLFRGHK